MEKPGAGGGGGGGGGGGETLPLPPPQLANAGASTNKTRKGRVRRRIRMNRFSPRPFVPIITWPAGAIQDHESIVSGYPISSTVKYGNITSPDKFLIGVLVLLTSAASKGVCAPIKRDSSWWHSAVPRFRLWDWSGNTVSLRLPFPLASLTGAVLCVSGRRPRYLSCDDDYWSQKRAK